MNIELTSTSRYRRLRWTRPLLAAIALSTVAACGQTTVAEPDEARRTRTVATEFGDVALPADPQRILALDEYAALNLMALDIEPMEAWSSYQSEVGAELIESAGITLTAASAEQLNYEAIAASDPDVIVATAEGAFIEHHERLSEIAPTVILPYSRPWRHVVGETGRIFDRPQQATEVVSALETRIAELRLDDGGTAESISLLGRTYDMLFAASNIAPISDLVGELGYTRPAAQAEGSPDPTFDAAVMISDEVLDDHDADHIVVFSGAYYDSESILSSPTFGQLPGVQQGSTVVVDGDMWFGTYPFAIFWALEDIAAVQTGDVPGGIGTVDDTAARWAAFAALT